MESAKCDTSRLLISPKSSPVSIGNREEEHIQPSRNKDKVKMLFMIGLGVGEGTGEPKVEIRRQVCQH